MLGFGVPFQLPNYTWTDLQLHRDALTTSVMGRAALYDAVTVDFKIALALSFLRRGSTTQIGMLALQNDPVDPNFPIALGPNSPGVVRANGLVALVGESVDVFSPFVTATCGIVAFGQDNGVAGNLWISAKDVGASSFTISTSNAADNGMVYWEIKEP